MFFQASEGVLVSFSKGQGATKGFKLGNIMIRFRYWRTGISGLRLHFETF